jgi:TPR repeat protein
VTDDVEAHLRQVTVVGVGQAALLVSEETAARDPARALELLELAATTGHPVALYTLGLRMAEENPELAADYLQRAAAGGMAEAKKALRRLRRSR